MQIISGTPQLRGVENDTLVNGGVQILKHVLKYHQSKKACSNHMSHHLEEI